jgi:hypothetical protein
MWQVGLVPGVLLVAASATALLVAGLCLRDGKLPNHGWVIERATQPVFYWMGILLYLAFAAGLLVVGISLLSRGS